MNESKPLVCSVCGQRGDEQPGFMRRQTALEAVWVGDDVTMVETFECCRCGHPFIVPIGAIEVRKP